MIRKGTEIMNNNEIKTKNKKFLIPIIFCLMVLLCAIQFFSIYKLNNEIKQRDSLNDNTKLQQTLNDINQNEIKEIKAFLNEIKEIEASLNNIKTLQQTIKKKIVEKNSINISNKEYDSLKKIIEDIKSSIEASLNDIKINEINEIKEKIEASLNNKKTLQQTIKKKKDEKNSINISNKEYASLKKIIEDIKSSIEQIKNLNPKNTKNPKSSTKQVSRFTKIQDKPLIIFKDNDTDLMWMHPTGTIDYKDFKEGKKIGNIEKSRNWRMPTLKELLTLHENKSNLNEIIDNIDGKMFWISTPMTFEDRTTHFCCINLFPKNDYILKCIKKNNQLLMYILAVSEADKK